MGKKTDHESNNASSGAEEEEEEYAVEKILDRRVRKGKVCIMYKDGKGEGKANIC